MKNLGNYEKLYPIEIPQDADQEKRVKLEAQRDIYEEIKEKLKSMNMQRKVTN